MGIEFGPRSIIIGSFQIYYYGIILMIGVVSATLLATKEAERRGKDPDFIWNGWGLFWIIVGGIVGARLWHILTPPPSLVESGVTTLYYLTHPLDAINIRAGGLGIPGAVIGGAVALYFYSRSQKEDFLTWVDIIVPGLALGQAIGRWGNFMNKELYGLPTELPWKIYIPPAYRLAEYASFEYYHPTFLYESLWNLGNMALLLWLARRFEKQLKAGDILLCYLIMYPFARILLEFIRIDSAQVAGLNINQAIMVVSMFVAVGLLVYRHKDALFRKQEPRINSELNEED